MGHKYVTIRIPKELTNEIDEIIMKRGYGYKSRAEFVKEALRIQLRVINIDIHINESNKTNFYRQILNFDYDLFSSQYSPPKRSNQ